MRSSLLSLLVLGACSIGTPGNEGIPIDAPPLPDAYTCDPMVTPGLAGPLTGDDELGSAHHPGEDCMACHTTGVEGAPIFGIAGTLYDTSNGDNPVSGATVVVTDGNGNQIRMPTASNGNFYSGGAVTSFGTTNPSTELGGTWVTNCPKKITMQTAPLGGCNAAGCHDGVSSTGRIYLNLTP